MKRPLYLIAAILAYIGIGIFDIAYQMNAMPALMKLVSTIFFCLYGGLAVYKFLWEKEDK